MSDINAVIRQNVVKVSTAGARGAAGAKGDKGDPGTGGGAIGDPVTSGTSGSLLFVDASGNLAQDNSNLFWDDANDRLGIGTNSPSKSIDILTSASWGGINVTNTHSGSGARIFLNNNDADIATFEMYGSGAGAGFAKQGGFGSSTGIVIYSNSTVGSGGSDSISFRTGGYNAVQEKMRILSNGNLGIGETTPLAKLHVDSGAIGTVGQIIKGVAGQTANLLEVQDSAGAVKAHFGGTGKLTLDTDQTYSSSSGLWFGDGDTGLVESTDDNLVVRVAGNNQYVFSSASFGGALGGSGGFRNVTTSSVVPTLMPNRADTNTGIGRAGADQLSLIAGATEMMRLDLASGSLINTGAIGNVGLTIKGVAGQTANLLEVQKSDGTVYSAFNEVGNLSLGSTPSFSASRKLKIFDDGVNGAARISLIGTESAGTTYPSIEMSMDGSIVKRILMRIEAESATAYGMSFFTSQSGATNERMRILGGGNVGIADDTPASKLTVAGDTEVTGSANGIILESPDATRYRVTVANGGTLSVAAV